MHFSLQALHYATDELKNLQNNHAAWERETKFSLP